MKKKILILGSSGNLGSFIFNELKKNTILVGVQRQKKQNFFQCKDLSDSNMNLETFKLIKKKYPSLDAIIICTGKSKMDKNKNIEKKFINSFRSNFLTVINSINSYQKIYDNKPIKIIIISSIAGIKAMEAPIEYSISKSALNHYCLIKAKQLAKYKIRLNIISPGNILNKNNNWYVKKKINSKKVKNYIKKNVPLNTFCKPNQILSLCKLLISSDGDFFLGSNIVMDGGQVL